MGPRDGACQDMPSDGLMLDRLLSGSKNLCWTLARAPAPIADCPQPKGPDIVRHGSRKGLPA